MVDIIMVYQLLQGFIGVQTIVHIVIYYGYFIVLLCFIGVYKPTNITGGHHPVVIQPFLFVDSCGLLTGLNFRLSEVHVMELQVQFQITSTFQVASSSICSESMVANSGFISPWNYHYQPLLANTFSHYYPIMCYSHYNGL